jgi:hypothetical protein
MRGLNRESVRGEHTELRPIEGPEKVNFESPPSKRKVLPISLGNFILSSYGVIS